MNCLPVDRAVFTAAGRQDIKLIADWAPIGALIRLVILGVALEAVIG